MTLGDLSTVLVWGAASAYTVALVAFAVDLARFAEAAGRERSARRALVGAGAAAQGAHSGSVALDGTADSGADTAGHSAADGGRSGAVAAAARGKAAGIALATAWLGLGLHLVGIVLRGAAAGRVPWANLYEFTIVGTFVAMGAFLVLQLRRHVRFLGTFVTLICVLAVVLALNAFYVEAVGVEPILQSYWLVLHVGVAIGATGIFTVAFVAAALQLLRDSRATGSARLSGPRWRLLDGLPPARDLESVSFRLNAVGFVMWTITVIGGAIWAEDAWGRYWGWDPKEVWSFVIWVVYAAYLHARTTRGWAGRRAAWFVVVGYACVIFNFTAVNLVFQGLHSYSGLPS